jgi:hypothetical protein
MQLQAHGRYQRIRNQGLTAGSINIKKSLIKLYTLVVIVSVREIPDNNNLWGPKAFSC